METIGVIAEYDPFHSGHAYHLAQVRAAFGADCAIVCAMSGHFVQRGEAALADKWRRAGLALRGGADLVLELPTLWAASSAERFARGGVSLLAATGVVDRLSFGSEGGDLAPLAAVADHLAGDGWQEGLRRGLDAGLSFPAARQRAVEEQLGPAAAACLRAPNDTLGVEYLRAIRTLGGGMRAHTVPRRGAGHGTETVAEHVSASYLRVRILAEDPAPLGPYLSAADEAALRADPAALRWAERAVLARLRTMDRADFAVLPDSGEGLGDRVYAAAQRGRTLEEVYALAKTKRYAHARIRRMVLWAFLHLTEADRPERPPYLRVLGFTARGQQLLRRMKGTAALPVLVKPAHAARLPEEAQRVFALEARCTALYDVCRREFGRTVGRNEYEEGPVRLG